MGFLAVKTDGGSAHQSDKCGLFSEQCAGNYSARVSDAGGDAVRPMALSEAFEPKKKRGKMQ